MPMTSPGRPIGSYDLGTIYGTGTATFDNFVGSGAGLTGIPIAAVAGLAVAPVTFAFTGNGTNTVFNIGQTINSASRVLWFEDGIWQQPGVDFTVSGTNVTRTTAPDNASKIYGILIGEVGVVTTGAHTHPISDITSLQTTLDSLQSSINSKETIDSNIVRANVNKALAAGYTTTAVDDGTKSSGTYTPAPTGGNLKRIINGGAFTLAAPTTAGDYSITIQVTNNASAGTITFTGFSKVDNSLITNTNGDDFFIYILKINGFIRADVAKLQ